jgi:hypothetical protein
MIEQTIWLAPRATAFTAVCEACAAQELGSENWLAATVEGRLRLEDRHATVSCPRGHVLRIERAAARVPVGAL